MGIWPTWVLVAIDHFSRAVIAAGPLEGPNAGWAIDVLAQAFLRQGPPRHPITDQDSLFTSDACRQLLRQWEVKQRFGAVGKHRSIAVTERLIRTLRQEWLARVPLIRGLDHLSGLLADFAAYYNECRGHRRLDGGTPSMVYEGRHWERPERSAKMLQGPIRIRHFAEARITVYELAA
jgi:transposase InsO family protein